MLPDPCRETVLAPPDDPHNIKHCSGSDSRATQAPMRILLALLLIGTPAGATTVQALRVEPSRIIVALDGAVPVPKGFALEGPRRLVVDLAGVTTSRTSSPGQGGIVRARIGPFDPGLARLVIELAEPMAVVRAAQGPDHRLVLTLARIDAAAFARAVARGRAPLLTEPALAADFDLPDDLFATTEPAAPPADGGRMPLVVIDAGHGGKDVGAISTLAGKYEKDATLAIARAAALRLRASGRVRVKLTRDGDRFIPLAGRVTIARAAKADLFISVHADSAPNAGARGASVYTLSETASDAVAARLAARENKADIIAGVDLGREAPEVGDILIDLEQRDTMNVAIAFAETLQRELAERIGFRGEFHHFAGFLVLKAADVPSVLLETGYVSNEDDARLLFSASGQRRIGEGIARAVEAHLLRQAAGRRRVAAPPTAAIGTQRGRE